MIIDSIDDGSNYRIALRSSSLVASEAVIDSLFTFCHQAGPLKCALYKSIPSAIHDRFYCVVDALKQNPVPIALAEPVLVSIYNGFIDRIVLSVYSPIFTYSILAAAIRTIETANQAALATIVPFI